MKYPFKTFSTVVFHSSYISGQNNPFVTPITFDWPLVWYLEAFEQRGKKREACDLVDPWWLLANNMAKESDSGQTAALLAHAFIHLI